MMTGEGYYFRSSATISTRITGGHRTERTDDNGHTEGYLTRRLGHHKREEGMECVGEKKKKKKKKKLMGNCYRDSNDTQREAGTK